MLKWLVIVLIVCSIFLLLLLGFGYLLKDNEEKNRSYIEQQAQAIPKVENRQTELGVQLPELAESPNQQIIKQYLTCISDQQCVITQATFADTKCFIAINTIGAAKLAQTTDKSNIGHCLTQADASTAVCRNNICQLVAADN